jgi:tetratricopeptide (TPR) repeat protein
MKNRLLMLPDISRMYYFLPANIILAMTMAMLINFFYKLRIPRWLILTAMCLAIAGNIIALPKHEEIIRQGHMQKYYQPSEALLEALKNPDSTNNDEFLSDNFTTYIFFKSKTWTPPMDSNDYNGKGIYYTQRCQFRKAIQNFNQAIITNPDNIQAYINRGNIYLKICKYQQAIEDFNEALRRKPDLTEAYYSRGLAYFRQDEDAPGCQDAQKACALGNCKLLKQAEVEGYCP